MSYMSKKNKVARQKLDKNFANYQSIALPPKGWIKAIRESLGMTATQMAKRLGITPSSVIALEKREKTRSITLSQMDKAAEQLDCRLEYVLIPNKPLEQIINDKIYEKAKKQLASVSHSMELEDQSILYEDLKQQLDFIIQDIMNASEKYVWEDDDVS